MDKPMGQSSHPAGRVFAALMFCAWVALTISGCGAPSKPRVPPRPSLSTGSRILILPFEDMTGIYGPEGLIKCPVCDSYFDAGPVSPSAPDFLTSRLISMLEKRTDYRIEFSNRMLGRFVEDAQGGQRMTSELENLVQEGRAVKAPYIMTGYVYRFRERVGRGYSAVEPASVAFSVHLIDTLGARVTWTGIYNETQQALTNNLFQLGTFVNRGGGWVRAEELAESGLESIMDGFVKQ